MSSREGYTWAVVDVVDVVLFVCGARKGGSDARYATRLPQSSVVLSPPSFLPPLYNNILRNDSEAICSRVWRLSGRLEIF